MGGAWLTGGLHALTQATGWAPDSADHIVGTSAGAMIGALAASGVPTWFMVAHSAGEVFEGLVDQNGAPVSEADRSAGAVFRVQRAWIPIPGSPRLAVASILNPSRHTGRARLAGWAPEGVISTEPLRETVRRAVPTGWVRHPNLWIVACDYDSGRRVVFGRSDAPTADLADAVAASCAIPGFYRAVTIGKRRYVDGGMHSVSNLDLMLGLDLDLVICLNPLSSRVGAGSAWPHRRVLGAMRRAAGLGVHGAADELRRNGTDVIVVEPTAEDLSVMGTNFMSRKRRHAVVETAVCTVGEQLQPHLPRLRGLPRAADHKIRRPEGPPSKWPWPERRDLPAGSLELKA
jgi:NTE family protein